MQRFSIRLPKWGIEELTGYTPKTTFWQDFSIADAFGESAVRGTFHRAFGEWKDNTEYVTELAMVLNHKIAQHYDRRRTLAVVYDGLWRKVDKWCCENLTGGDLLYYYETTD